MAGLSSVEALAMTGHVPRTEEVARETLSSCEGAGLQMVVNWTKGFSAVARVISGSGVDAVATLRALLEQKDQRLAVAARALLSQVLLNQGDVREAKHEAEAGTDDARFPREGAIAWCSRALVALHSDLPEDALTFAERGLDWISRAPFASFECALLLARAEALHALGRTEAAHSTIREGRDRVLRTSATLGDLELRHSYLHHVVTNTRTLALAEAWLAES
jgi:hypothetical protein